MEDDRPVSHYLVAPNQAVVEISEAAPAGPYYIREAGGEWQSLPPLSSVVNWAGPQAEARHWVAQRWGYAPSALDRVALVKTALQPEDFVRPMPLTFGPDLEPFVTEHLEPAPTVESAPTGEPAPTVEVEPAQVLAQQDVKVTQLLAEQALYKKSP